MKSQTRVKLSLTFSFGFELELARFRYSNELFQPILTRVYSHCNEKKFSL